MANGLAGNEYEFYDIVKGSPWLGGVSEYSPLYEGFPYWFNGLVPLAYGLNDSRLKYQVHEAVNYVISHQQDDGWLGPETDPEHRDLWGRFPLLLGLAQLVEADSRFEPRLVPAMHNYVHYMHSLLTKNKGLGEIWGRARYADMIIVLQWLYENHPESNEKVLLDSMGLLKTHGLDWAAYFTAEEYMFDDLDMIDLAKTESLFGFVHAVNAGQGLKTGAVDYRFTHNQSLLRNTRDGVNWTFTYHGAASGTIIGDEREAGLAPNRGSELCTAVETMYSLSYLFHVLGDSNFADRCELAAFNALPVMFTSDGWAHQYIAQPNQPWSRKIPARGLFWNVGDYGTTYGTDPNYPCCTVNFPQGYPKFLAASFARVGPMGLAHTLLAPSQLSTTLPIGVQVNITCNTSYPFANDLHYDIRSTDGFVFFLRIPQWNPGQQILVQKGGDSKSQHLLEIDPHTRMASIRLPPGHTTLSIKLQPSIRIEERANSTVSIHHGSLLYALDVGESVEIIPPAIALLQTPLADFMEKGGNHPEQARSYVITNTRPWNFAIDPSTLILHTDEHMAADLPNPIWAHGAPPTWITAKGCQIHWPLFHEVPGPVPLPSNRTCIGPVEEVILRPYGSLRVHMSDLPVVKFNVSGG